MFSLSSINFNFSSTGVFHFFLKFGINVDNEFISPCDEEIVTRARRQMRLPISPFFLIRTSVLDGEETGREATARQTKRERVNPESHGNLATSAIGRTCTRSNLKARSRTRESERERKRENGHSFIRTRAIRFVRTYVHTRVRPIHRLRVVVFYLPFTISAVAAAAS